MSIELPPLPRPFPNSYPYSYTADQMRAYAHACVNAALERAAQERRNRWVGGYPGEVADDCADAISAMKIKEQK